MSVPALHTKSFASSAVSDIDLRFCSGKKTEGSGFLIMKLFVFQCIGLVFVCWNVDIKSPIQAAVGFVGRSLEGFK